MGAASSNAFTMPVDALMVPGPDEVFTRPTFPAARAYPCAIIAAPCSWRVWIARTPSRIDSHITSNIGPPAR
jgi:hypothetical protein